MFVSCSIKRFNGLQGSNVRAKAVTSIAVRPPQPIKNTAIEENREDFPTNLNIRNESRPTFILPGEYDASCVGPSAMALGEPRWTMPPHVEVEKSVSFTKGSMFKIISESYENAAACRHIQALMSAKGKAGTTSTRKLANKRRDESGAARDALRKLKLPQSFRDKFVDACIKARIPVPIVRDDWESLRREVAAAFVAMLSIMAFQETPVADEEFGQHASILFRDRSKRAYTFTAIVDSCRRVYVSIGMPHCEGRGIGAVCGRAAIGSPRTVHHPERACTIGGGTKLVALDVPHSMRIPRQIAMHHRETDGGPAKVRTSFEGDNMLMVPRFRQQVFASIARAAIETMEIRAWEGMADCRVRVPSAAEIRGFVNPDLGLVVSSIQETHIDTTSKPWTLESRF